MPIVALAGAVILRLTPMVVTGIYPPPATAAPPPDGAASIAYYPEHAQQAHIEGEAVVRCAIAPQGQTLSDCHVMSEDPKGEGFGDKAVMMSGLLKMASPADRAKDNKDGQIVGYELPFEFRLKDAGGKAAAPSPPQP